MVHSTTSASPKESTIDLPVSGMTCAACVARVERALAKVPGVTVLNDAFFNEFTIRIDGDAREIVYGVHRQATDV